MRRVTSVEFLDHDLGTPPQIAALLDDLWRINRYLGGLSSNRALLEAFFRRTGLRAATWLEIGAGDGRLGVCLRERLRRRGFTLECVALDRQRSHLAARRAALRPVVADALALPFAPDSFDVVACNLLFHHFSGERAVALLAAMYAVARVAVLVSDLERHVLPYLFIRVAPWLVSNPLSRHDAVASVRQAYTRAELEGIVRQAGFAHFEIRRFAPFRLGLTIWKRPGPELAGGRDGARQA